MTNKLKTKWIQRSAPLVALVFLIACGSEIQTEVYRPISGEGKYILTPEAPGTPQINGPAVFGVRPGSPFLYTIPATGQRPLTFEVQNLPAGLQLDVHTGVISGTISDKSMRNYNITLVAKNQLGVDRKVLEVKVGQTICLTPPLGWNSWNCWKTQVTQERVLASARAMVDKGLSNYGWSFINIDDAWQGLRGGKHQGIQADPVKFPDMKQMCDEIHAMGLKVGIYSSPWITTYAGYVGGSSQNPEGDWDDTTMHPDDLRKTKAFWQVGEYTFDDKDALQWADWGIDYLKYDWNPNDRASTQRMADALQNSGRDIVYSLSNTAPMQHADLFSKVVNCFRTAGDLKDRWDQEGSHLNIREEWVLHRNWLDSAFSGSPGHYPDADMLVIGDVVTSGPEGKPVPSRLTADEQYSHVSLWTLWSSPLLIGCPIETLDDFTLNLLTNSEVLDIHQDAVGVAAQSVYLDEGSEIFVKVLADGSKAVGLFNTGKESQTIAMPWSLAKLQGVQQVRDVWRQKDIGLYEGKFSAQVPSHGVVLVRFMANE
ncbi:putative Ig domain-containing protein [Reichenbachiella carrageenanivorans]|uniref:Alpha-galactosidase n=1 Tax=Reichenbachiella carrageenanivorans TaxID=2979869 RepID=A0ABY6D4K4_9BACT|nr:putative Ig domain-containing protein [Reichenbachiella carrageenanivorans]UXX81087.1 putative Ig domain-containing protein [Reichenbachiella carrageenanivorans]